MKRDEMKKEYDFSKGTRGKFYNSNMKIRLPIYLDEDNLEFVKKIAKKKKMDLSKTVNEIIRVDKELAKTIV